MTRAYANQHPETRRSPDPAELLSRNPELRLERDDYNINVTVPLGEALSPVDAALQIRKHQGAGRPAHLYFHVPLCSYICAFCNYVKKSLPSGPRRQDAIDEWAQLLIQESEQFLDLAPWARDARIESLYFGGGTASVLGLPNLEALLRHIRARYELTEDCEITLEGNPDDMEGDMIPRAIMLGVNRFSLGVQSFDERVTTSTGRGHDAAMSMRAIEKMSRSTMPFNVDLMFGLPHQSVQSVSRDISLLTEQGVPTITIYRLRNADRQKLGIGVQAAWNSPAVKAKLESEGIFPSLNATYDMRRGAVDVLLENGYSPSPLGWWSRPGTYQPANIPRVSRNKWERYDSMLAFGPGAYGWLTAGSEAIQVHHDTSIAGHAERVRRQSCPVVAARRLSGTSALGTALGFNFKSGQPIRVDRYRKTYGIDIRTDEPYAGVMQLLTRKGFLTLSGAEYRPTLEAEVLHEEIISIYFHGMLGGTDAACKKVE